MVYFKLGWREITKHPGRSFLTLMSIVIGVAAVMAVTLTTQTTRRAFDDIFQSIAGRASLEIAGPLGTTFDAALLKEVSAVPGVEAAAPLMQRRSIIYVGKKRVQLMSMGIDPQLDQAIHDFKVVAGPAAGRRAGRAAARKLCQERRRQAGRHHGDSHAARFGQDASPGAVQIGGHREHGAGSGAVDDVAGFAGRIQLARQARRDRAGRRSDGE